MPTNATTLRTIDTMTLLIKHEMTLKIMTVRSFESDRHCCRGTRNARNGGSDVRTEKKGEKQKKENKRRSESNVQRVIILAPGMVCFAFVFVWCSRKFAICISNLPGARIRRRWNSFQSECVCFGFVSFFRWDGARGLVRRVWLALMSLHGFDVFQLLFCRCLTSGHKSQWMVIAVERFCVMMSMKCYFSRGAWVPGLVVGALSFSTSFCFEAPLLKEPNPAAPASPRS